MLPVRLEISCPGLASTSLVFQEFEEQPFLNLSPDVLLRPAKPCFIWLGQGGTDVKSLSVHGRRVWQFRPNRLWCRHLHTPSFDFSSKVIVNKLLHGPGCYSVPGGFSNASFTFLLHPSTSCSLVGKAMIGQALQCQAAFMWLGRLMKLRESTEGRLGALQRLASLWWLPFIYGAIAHAVSITSPLSSSVLPPPFLLFQLTKSFPLPFISR